MGFSQVLKQKLALLPASPGCYLFKEGEEVLYVGKAKNLASRVRSYFSSQPKSAKVQALVERIQDVDIILAATNLEALVLENNLIKQHRPFFNIKLMDDKNYPYIRLSVQEPFPRLSVARRVENDGARYFGPFYGTAAIKTVSHTLRKAFPLRSCTLSLPSKKPLRPCIAYEMGQCLGPCAGLVSQAEYGKLVDQVIAFLKGKTTPVLSRLEQEMLMAAEQLQFERAAQLRDAIRDIHGLMEQQLAIQTSGQDQDILALVQDGLDAMVQVLFIRGGKMLEAQAHSLPGEGSEPPGEVLDAFVSQFYQNRVPARTVALMASEDRDSLEAWLRQVKGGAVSVRLPQRGDLKDLVDGALKNAQDALIKRNAREQVVYERTIKASAQLAEALGLVSVPRRIEGFDISNTQGQHSVASMVVFQDGQPRRQEYRQFNVKTVEGANDFASMNEVLTRRFRRALQADKPWPLPDLILVDGGPQQLAFALLARDSLGLEVPIFGLSEQQEEIWLPGHESPIRLDRRAPALHLVQRIRDEAHRFALIHHRKKRGKAAIKSGLEDIPGIGPARRRALLSAFRSLGGIAKQDLDSLKALPGMSAAAAQAVYQAFHPQAGQDSQGEDHAKVSE